MEPIKMIGIVSSPDEATHVSAKKGNRIVAGRILGFSGSGDRTTVSFHNDTLGEFHKVLVSSVISWIKKEI